MEKLTMLSKTLKSLSIMKMILLMKPNIIQNQGMAKSTEIFPLKEQEITMEGLTKQIFIKIKMVLKII